MLASMTGFGRAVTDTSLGKLVAEIQSVNRKYLEIFVSLPKEFTRFEPEVRSWISERVARGQVSVRLSVISSSDATVALLPDVKTLGSLKKGWEKIAKGLGYDPKAIDLSFLLLHSPIQQKLSFAKDSDLGLIETCLKAAIDGLVEMKLKEGKSLGADIKKRLAILKKHVTAIEALAPDASRRMQKNLAEKVKALEASPELDERLAREVAIFAERVDISEEMTRLESHFGQFMGMLQTKKEPVGRKMDFLIQEMGREVNTIGSKSSDAKITHLVVEMKSELEKIREQTQNIE
jgi:uncharacterized protein (TIGR00255 family)